MPCWQSALPSVTAASNHICSPTPPLPRPAEFARLVGSALHPEHGCFLLNLHSVDGRDTIANFREALLGSAHSAGNGIGGIGASHTASSNGSSSSPSSSSSGTSGGSCFVVSTQRQLNVCIAVARGLELPADSSAARERLKQVAAFVADEAGYRFPAGGRASRGFQPL